MPRHTKQDIESQYRKIPSPLKDALLSPEIAEKMYAIGKKFGLTIDRTGELSEETGYIIMGLNRPGEFVAALKTCLQVDESMAREISQEINHQIFHPLREILKSAHQFDISAETIQKGGVAVTSVPAVSPALSAIKKSEMRIGREPIIDDESRSMNQESRTEPKPAATTPPLTIPKPPTTPTTIPTAAKPGLPTDLKDEVIKILKTPEIKTPPVPPPAGTMPSWMTKQELGIMNKELGNTNKELGGQPIDLRSQYKPTMPPSSPKVPPINLRELGIKNKELGGEPPKSRTTTPVPVTPATPTQIMQETVTTSKSQPTSKLELGIRNKELGDNLNKQPETTKNKTSSSEIDPYRESVN